MKKSLVFLLCSALGASAIAGGLKYKALYAWKYTDGEYKKQNHYGKFYGADSVFWVEYLNPYLSDGTYDMDFILSVDRSAYTTDTLTLSIMAIPVVYDPTHLTRASYEIYSGAILREKAIYLSEYTTGRSSESFSFHPDSTYVFHSGNWWDGMNVIAVIFRAVYSASDSLDVDKAATQYIMQ